MFFDDIIKLTGKKQNKKNERIDIVMSLSQKDTIMLRELGAKYMELASLPVQKKKMELWKSLNRCEMERPMVVIDQLPWNELNVNDELTCQAEDPFWRKFEGQLRQTIYKWNHFPADMVLEPYLTIPACVSATGYGLDVIEDVLVTNENETASSHRYINQLKELEDIEKIKDMDVASNPEETGRRLEEAKVLFDGIAPVRPGHGVQFHLGVWDKLTLYMSIQDIYYDLVDRPEFLHAAMDRITNATLRAIESANALNVHDDTINTCHCSYTYTDELLPDFGAGKGSVSKNSWAFGLAQLFSCASPQLTEEFEIPYITKMAEQFGMIYYGCCERLDDRLDLIKKIPNLKKVSCSPWSEREAFAEKIGKNLVMSNKPTPAFLSGASMDENIIKEDLLRTCNCAKNNGVNLEIILKDISTVNFDPRRLTKWAQIAMSIVESY